LKPGLLYNTQLKTVVEHFELKQLEQRDRVLTVYRIFTGTQRAKIAEAITFFFTIDHKNISYKI
jgi:hypothetical protein